MTPLEMKILHTLPWRKPSFRRTPSGLQGLPGPHSLTSGAAGTRAQRQVPSTSGSGMGCPTCPRSVTLTSSLPGKHPEVPCSKDAGEGPYGGGRAGLPRGLSPHLPSRYLPVSAGSQSARCGGFPPEALPSSWGALLQPEAQGGGGGSCWTSGPHGPRHPVDAGLTWGEGGGDDRPALGTGSHLPEPDVPLGTRSVSMKRRMEPRLCWAHRQGGLSLFPLTRGGAP